MLRKLILYTITSGLAAKLLQRYLEKKYAAPARARKATSRRAAHKSTA